MEKTDTIFALSTPIGRSALAIFRVSGTGALKVIKDVSSVKKFENNKTKLNIIKDKKGKPIDQTLTTYFKKPRSFTGEDMVEISCHGSIAIIKKISKELSDKGLRIAEPGEFTRRALENDKLDLIKVEALSDLINSNTEKQREFAFTNFQGQLTNHINILSNKITKMLADTEAIIDFVDDDLPKNIIQKIKEQNKNIIKHIEKMLVRSSLADSIINGFVVSVIGKPNTGKSSFINYISGRDVSIVSPSPGTTRDLIESLVEINGYQVRLIDTAGIRRHRNKIEEIGVKKALNLSKESDLNIIFLSNNETKLYKHMGNKIFVRSKYDIRKNKHTNKEISNISSKTGHGVEKLLKKTIKKLLPNNKEEIPIISRERQLIKIKNCLKQLKVINFDKNIDMVSADIRLAHKELQEIYHKFDVEQILDIIFNDFCIGK